VLGVKVYGTVVSLTPLILKQNDERRHGNRARVHRQVTTKDSAPFEIIEVSVVASLIWPDMTG